MTQCSGRLASIQDNDLYCSYNRDSINKKNTQMGAFKVFVVQFLYISSFYVILTENRKCITGKNIIKWHDALPSKVLKLPQNVTHYHFDVFYMSKISKIWLGTCYYDVTLYCSEVPSLLDIRPEIIKCLSLMECST